MRPRFMVLVLEGMCCMIRKMTCFVFNFTLSTPLEHLTFTAHQLNMTGTCVIAPKILLYIYLIVGYKYFTYTTVLNDSKLNFEK